MSLQGYGPDRVSQESSRISSLTTVRLRCRYATSSSLFAAEPPLGAGPYIAQQLSEAEELLKYELLDDPFWTLRDVEFSWDAYHDYLAEPNTMAGHYAVSLFPKIDGRNLRVFQKPKQELEMVWSEASQNPSKTINMLRTCAH